MAVVDRYIEKEIGGEKRKFLKPTRRIRDRLYESAHAWKKERKSHNLRLAGIDGDEMVERLDEFDRENKCTPEDLLDYVNAVGVTELIEKALADYDGKAAAIADEVADPIGLACELWGWKINEAAPATAPPDGADRANPPQPLPPDTTTI